LKDIEDARDALEGTYLIRLYAEFQGLLKHQLAANHPATKIPPNSNADWLVSRVLRAEGIKADPALRARLDSVRDYRNDLAHQNNVPQMLTFQEALSTLNTLVAKLSEPLA